MSNDMLPGFRPSEEDLVQMALDMPLEKKIEKAIIFYQTHCDGAYGAFSGGKDSCVIKQLAIDAGVDVDWHYNNVTIDPPELVWFIKRHHSEVKWNNPDTPLLVRVVEKANPPTRMGRWCCKEYKEQCGEGRDRVIGVRIAESARRAKLWKQIVPHKKDNTNFFCPIAYWTDKDVWDYIALRNLPYCRLYDEGFSRLGCIGCPLGGPKNQRKEFDRWPRYEQAWKRAFYRLWDRWHGIPNQKGEPRFFEKYGSPEEFWRWWIRGKKSENTDQCIFDEIMEQR